MSGSGRTRTRIGRSWRSANTMFLIVTLLCVMMLAIARWPWQPSAVTIASAGTPIAATPAFSEDGPVTIDDRTIVANAFPVGLHVTGELRGAVTSGTLSLLYQAGYDTGWNLIDVPASDITPTNDGLRIDTVIDLQSVQVPLGVHLRYRWMVSAPEGSTHAVSAIRATDWFDDRQPWQRLTSVDITLNTYGMAPSFAQAMLDSAQGTVDTLRIRFDLAAVTPLTLWIYPDANAFREGLPANFRESVVGGSIVGYPLIVAVIPPDSTSEIGRVIPHEISHQLLYQATQNPFALVPTWFDEGLATHVQIGGTSGYMGMVIAAERRGGLFDLTSLTESFPYTASQASLAYAASWSAIAFIEERWGDVGITAMIHAFAAGLPEDAAIQRSLGISMETFDRDWKTWIRERT